MSAFEEITVLLYRYGACMDAADFEGACQLFEKAQVRLPAMQDMPGSAMLDIWRSMIILYPCGTPRTQHMVTNPIVTVDADGKTATCQSRYMVLQQTEEVPLQMIAAGHYTDRFARDAEGWHFTFRDYSHLKLPGDLSRHLRTNHVSAANSN